MNNLTSDFFSSNSRFVVAQTARNIKHEWREAMMEAAKIRAEVWQIRTKTQHQYIL